MWRKKFLRVLLAAFGSLAFLFLAGAAAFLLLILPGTEIRGARDPAMFAAFNEALVVERTTKDGISYVLNNSAATFHLDVAAPDEHCSRLFPDYASALRYAGARNLPVIPSTHLVAGKCKAFDDGLCAAIGLAIQRGALQGALGRRAALERLARGLQAQWSAAPAEARPAVERALVHVATALDLGGAPVNVGPPFAARTREAKERFLADARRSRPVGFWTDDEGLRAIFLQDRFLSRGFRVADATDVIIVLARAVAGGEELARAFDRFRDLDARLTNPPVFIDLDRIAAPQATCLSFRDVASLLPADADLAALSDPALVAQVRTTLRQRYGADAGFALVAYAESKEYAFLRRLQDEGTLSGADATMDLIVDAIRSGRVSLEPKPHSGWYDYQWHALETLVAPDRARESMKLKLTEAYRKRLREAFAAVLAKRRDTQIKQLPVITLGAARRGEPKVRIGPEFSAEPTLTVYLRTARGYRFLRNAIAAVLGEHALGTIRRGTETGHGTGESLDAELRRMALLLYGLYERLSPEIGLTPDYLEGEISAEEVREAKETARQWLASLETDGDLSADSRVAVPIFDYPMGPIRYWATGGVKLVRVAYEFDGKPMVDGEVSPVFVPTTYYLPTDVFFEFERPGVEPLTREEWRAICDGHPEEGSLRRAVGATDRALKDRWDWAWLIAAAILLTALLFVAGFRSRLAAVRWGRLMKRVGLAVAMIVLLSGMVVGLSPYYRARFLCRYVARVNTHLGLWCERHFYDSESTGEAAGLASLLADSNSQVRYLASRFLKMVSLSDEQVISIAGLRDTLRRAASDPVPEVAENATTLLGAFRDPDTVDFLLRRLDETSHADGLCVAALSALRWIGDPRALPAFVRFTHDARPIVRRIAIGSLGLYDDETAVNRLTELLQSADEQTGKSAASAAGSHRDKFADSQYRERFDPALLAAAADAAFDHDRRLECARLISDVQGRVAACVNLLEHPSAQTGSWEREKVIYLLGEIGPEAAPAIPVLKKALADADADVRRAAAEAIEKIREPK